eukprot:1154751-Pelagomonas_calceolata.AAC.3
MAPPQGYTPGPATCMRFGNNNKQTLHLSVPYKAWKHHRLFDKLTCLLEAQPLCAAASSS